MGDGSGAKNEEKCDESSKWHSCLCPSSFLSFRCSRDSGERVGGKTLELKVVKADDLSPTPWPPGTIEARAVSTNVTSGTNIYMMLQANGIAPDPGAFSLVYDLNPTLRDVNDLAPQNSVQLPSVTPAQQLKEVLAGHALVEVTVDPDVRRQLNLQIQTLQQFESSVALLTPDLNTQAHIKSLIDWYEQIERRFKRKTDPPLGQATLMELLSEAKLLSSILEGAVKQSKPLKEADQQQIASIFEDRQTDRLDTAEIVTGIVEVK